jgi:hypothetical protein
MGYSYTFTFRLSAEERQLLTTLAQVLYRTESSVAFPLPTAAPTPEQDPLATFSCSDGPTILPPPIVPGPRHQM